LVDSFREVVVGRRIRSKTTSLPEGVIFLSTKGKIEGKRETSLRFSAERTVRWEIYREAV